MSAWKGVDVLVTGSNGFIGKYLAASLTAKGASVSGLSNSGHGDGHIKFISGDITRPETLKGACKGIDAIFHLAAISNVARSIQYPSTTLNINTMGTVNLLEEARASGVKKFVYISSAHVYGAPLYLPVDEKHPLVPREPYAASKIAAENIVQAYGNAYGLQCSIIRPFNVFGAGQDESFLIPGVIAQALREKRIMVGNTEPTRDFLFVKDAVEGFILIGREGSGIYNIGSGEEVSILDVVTKIRDMVDAGIPILPDKDRMRAGNVEIPRMCADVSKLKALGWKPSYTFEEALRQTVEEARVPL